MIEYSDGEERGMLPLPHNWHVKMAWHLITLFLDFCSTAEPETALLSSRRGL